MIIQLLSVTYCKYKCIHGIMKSKGDIIFPLIYLKTHAKLIAPRFLVFTLCHFIHHNVLFYNKPVITKWTVPAIRATRTAQCRSTTWAPGRACWVPPPCHLPPHLLVLRPDGEKPAGESWRAVLWVTATRPWTSTRRPKNCKGPVTQRCVLCVCLCQINYFKYI